MQNYLYVQAGPLPVINRFKETTIYGLTNGQLGLGALEVELYPYL